MVEGNCVINNEEMDDSLGVEDRLTWLIQY